jgi:hypothetical protein
VIFEEDRVAGEDGWNDDAHCLENGLFPGE